MESGRFYPMYFYVCLVICLAAMFKFLTMVSFDITTIFDVVQCLSIPECTLDVYQCLRVMFYKAHSFVRRILLY